MPRSSNGKMMKNRKTSKEEIQKTYEKHKPMIKKRLGEFTKYRKEKVAWHYSNEKLHLVKSNNSFNQRMFEELCFCILTANTSAVLSLNTIPVLRSVLQNGTKLELKNALVKARYRFINKRAEYIHVTRESLKTKFQLNFKSMLSKQKNLFETRKFFRENVKGFGYKESSHFLRNIGYSGLAILDKHILKTLKEHEFLNTLPKTLTETKYLEIEEIFCEFSEKINIPVDELDIVLWYLKTGKILK